MDKLIIICIVLFLAGCHSLKPKNTITEKDQWIIAYKNAVFISCISQSDHNVDVSLPVIKNDISTSICFDVLGDKEFSASADSVGRFFHTKIFPSPILDFGGGKAIINECLAYYESNLLDSIAHNEYKKFCKKRKAMYN